MPRTHLPRRDRPSGRRLAATLVAAVLAFAACSGSDDAATTPTTAPQAATNLSAPTTAGTTTTGLTPRFGTLDVEFAAELRESDDPTPFFMVNLIDHREHAEYADGRPTDLTGEEADELYSATGVQQLIAGGMRVALGGKVAAAAGTDDEWDQVGIARYPSYAEFFALTADPTFQEGAEHKDAGVERSLVIVTHRIDDPPAAAELERGDEPVVLFELLSYDGEGTDLRPAAVAAHRAALEDLARTHGGTPIGTYEVVGTFIGDERSWDEAYTIWFADRSGAEALLADPELAELAAARDDALLDAYTLLLDPVLVEPFGREP